MAIGTAIVVLGIIGFCIASPGFRRFFLWGSAIIAIVLTCIIQHDLESRNSPKIHVMSDAEMGIVPQR